MPTKMTTGKGKCPLSSIKDKDNKSEVRVFNVIPSLKNIPTNKA